MLTFLARNGRVVNTGGRIKTQWLRKQRAVSTTAKPAPDPQNFILKRDIQLHIPQMTLPDVVWAKLDKYADKTATVCNETGRSYKFLDIWKRSKNFAKWLRGRLKLQRGNTVAIFLPNVPEYPIAILGIIEAGLIATTINPTYKAEEISRQLLDSEAKAIITLGNSHKNVLEAINTSKITIPIITIKNSQNESTPSGTIDFEEICSKEIDYELEPLNLEDVIVLPYSSGTTGLPKGVQLNHRNLVSNLSQFITLSTIFEEATSKNQDIVPVVLPMFHIYGLVVNTFSMLEKGCKLITMPKFTPEIYIDMLEKHKPHHLMLVPPIVIFLAAHADVKSSHLDGLKSIMSGAAPLGATDLERFLNKAGREIVSLQGYGMTETSPVIAVTECDKWKESIGSIGSVVPNTEVKIVSLDDPNFTPLGPNEPGELLVKGPQVMLRYHKNPKATEETFQDGWLRTGDMAYYDKNKFLWITDRLKELIKVKGFQVAPAELEALIRDHPTIADAAVIGIPHPIYGEVPKAFVVAKANVKVNPEEIQDYVAKKVASYKKLEGGVTILNAIPKNPSGKIMRRTLKLEYADT